ncbi:hypothetical protein BELL_2004g00010 [Botrytis elliptica]|uniref:Uncharacterized protein n=1 Tax=Botrytis elliptica TaxID=278938 RepID=A0A4Z1HTG1_9HELO|nr:hypothetical protein EAE99_009817 [Botrytis elliptica]TGO48263.1 hypothetical protein BELL_2004g00010 [Botrytis elliptica]
MVDSNSLLPDVEKLITDPEVLRVLRLFISLGRTDIIKFLNETVNQNPKEVQITLDTVYFFVKRGLRTQRYLTSQMRTDVEPSDWPYDPDEENSFTSVERQLLDKYKFGARWPTVRGAIDIFRRGLMHCVDKMTWKDSDTGLTYRAWNTFVIFYPGLVNLAFLEQGQADVLARAEGHFDRLWARDEKFRKATVNLTRSVLKYYGSVDDGYTNYEGLLPKEKLAKERRIILDDFDAQRKAMLKADASDFREFSHAGWWLKYGKFWSPGNSVGSILHSNKMLMGKSFRDHCNLANDSKEISTEVATRAVRHYGFGYVPTMMTRSSRSRSSSKASLGKTGTEKEKGEKREKSRDKHREEQNQSLPIRNSRDHGSSLKRTESPGQQRQESKSKTIEARTPAKKSSRGTKKPAAQVDNAAVPSSSRTGGSGHSGP